MLFENSLHAGKAKVTATIALCLALAAAPLAACSGQQAKNSGEDVPAVAATTGSVDPSSWKTLGDALATQTDAMAASWSDKYYVTLFKVNDQVFRVVAELDPETSAKVEAVDWSKDDVSKQIEQAASAAPIKSVEDLTPEILTPEQLADLKGKTGRELVDEGWVFESYFMYGGEQTGATFSKGYLAYGITFDVTTPEDKSEDGGASVMDGKVVEAAFQGASNAGIDTSAVS